jgi:hypothetical protein
MRIRIWAGHLARRQWDGMTDRADGNHPARIGIGMGILAGSLGEETTGTRRRIITPPKHNLLRVRRPVHRKAAKGPSKVIVNTGSLNYHVGHLVQRVNCIFITCIV